MGIPLWRNKPPREVILSSANNFDVMYIFPSGRQAISYCLQEVGLARADRVAIPEWSSNCVISAVGSVATPIPIREVLECELEVDGVLVYAQWGWPIPSTFLEELFNRFPSAYVVIDQVDSPFIGSSKFQLNSGNLIEIWSLSKILGLEGGGIAKINGNYQCFIENENHQLLYHSTFKEADDSTIFHLLKTHLEVLPTNVGDYLQTYDVLQEIKLERESRRINMSIFFDSPIVEGYPRWMFDAYDLGAAPGIMPILLWNSDEKLEMKAKQLARRYGIETRVYHFNVSGNPCACNYEKCIAFPIHGMVNPKLICSAIKCLIGE